MRILARGRAAAALVLSGLVAISTLAVNETVAQAEPTGLELITPAVDPAQPRAEEMTIAMVSDFGACGYNDPVKCARQVEVRDMIRSWNPDAILTAGDNSQQIATEEQVRLSLEPYMEEIERGIFFPIFGNHDYGNTCDAEGAKYSIQYMKVPVSYRAVLGNGLIEWMNPNGACQSSNLPATPPIFADYQHSVTTSDASWVLTGVHQPPYSSGKSGNNINKRWTMIPGVDLLFSGHDHHSEFVISPDAYNLVVTGNGGDGTTRLFTPTTGSQWRQNEHLGAMRLTVRQDTLRAEFVKVGGETMYEFTLAKDPSGKAVVVDRTPWTDPGTGTGTGGIPAKREVYFDVAAGVADSLTPLPYPDGPWVQQEVDGRQAIQLTTNPSGGGNHLYMDAADDAVSGGPFDMELEVTYRAPQTGSFVIQYESTATGAAYERSISTSISSSQVGTWQTATIPLPAAAFNNRQNGNADMRLLAASNLPLAISKVVLRSTVDEIRSVSTNLTGEPEGLTFIDYESGPYSRVDVEGVPAIRIEDRADGSLNNNLYLSVDDRYITGGPHDAWVTVTYRADTTGRFRFQYDNVETGQAYTNAPDITVAAADLNTWLTQTVALPKAAFQNRQNGNADLRILAPSGFNPVISDITIDLFDPANQPEPTPMPTPTTTPTPGVTPTPQDGRAVSWTATNPDGIDPVTYESGPFSIVELDGENVLQVEKNPANAGNNLYLQVDDALLNGGPHEVWLTLQYRSPLAGRIIAQYDDFTTGAAYTDAPGIDITEDQVDQWHTATVHLPTAMFQNRQNGEADLRLRAGNNLPFLLREIRIDLTDPALAPTEEPTPVPSASPSAEPSTSPSAAPSNTPPASPSESPTSGPATAPTTAPSAAPVNVYTTPGVHRVNGRVWSTSCEAYSQTQRCRTEIWASVVKLTDQGYQQVNGWAFNNLTYLQSERSLWKGNPLGTAGTFESAGRQWRTECDTEATGRGACRSYALTSVAQRDGDAFVVRNQWVLNNLVLFRS